MNEWSNSSKMPSLHSTFNHRSIAAAIHLLSKTMILLLPFES
jgi:hypothetical protein